LTTRAVERITIVMGRGPQSKVMIPPAATARITALDVQLAGRPSPITWLECLVSTARPAGGTGKCPLGLPGTAAAAGIAASPIITAPDQCFLKRSITTG